jgi:xylitol oxidase
MSDPQPSSVPPDSHPPVRNWAGNVAFRAARVHRPSTLDELRRIVAEAGSVRVLGSGHSFNRIADTGADLVRVDGLPAEVELAEDGRTATVAAGMRLAELAARLHAAGRALANLPSLPHISLAGTVATGTHGSGDGNQGLAALVRAVRMVGPDGGLVELSRERTPEFAGTVVALGALGVVTHLTVAIEPDFEVAQRVYQGVPIDRFIERHAEVHACGYSVSGFTDWRPGGAFSVWRKLRTAGDGRHPDEGGADEGAALIEELGGRPATEAAHPVPGMPAGNCTPQFGLPGPWHERLPHFRPEFTPSNGRELQSEFFVSREAAGAALAAVHALGARIAPVLQIGEVRTIAADDLWLSPASGRASLALHFTWIADRAAVEPVLAELEQALLPLGARPHWGKLYHSGPEAAVAAYPRAAEFRRLLERYDPQGKFRNPFVDGLFPVTS